MGLSLPVFKWTKTGNYPAGGDYWSGQPLAAPPAGSYVTPNTVLDAEDLNWIWGTEASDAMTLYQGTASMQVQNWPVQQMVIGNSYFQGSSVIDSVMGACWDKGDQKWWFVTKLHNGSNHSLQVFSTIDGVNFGNFTTQPSTTAKPLENVNPNQYFVAIATDPSTANKVWVGYTDQSNPDQALLYTVTGTSWTAVGNYTATSTVRVQLHYFNGHMLQGFGCPASGQAAIYRDHGPQVIGLASLTAEAIVFADNSGNGGPGNLCIAMNCLGTSPGAYWTSADGVTWTAQSFQLLGGGTIPSLGSMYAFGIVWTADAQGPCWLLGFQYGSEPVFYRSTDGINWSLQSQPTQFSAAVGTCLTLASNGSPVIVVTGSDGYQGAYSLDGGVTWFASAQASYPPNATFPLGNNDPTATWYSPNSAVANDGGFCFYNSVGMKFSLQAGLGVSLN